MSLFLVSDANGQTIPLLGRPVLNQQMTIEPVSPMDHIRALEARVLLLEEMTRPTKVHADSWSIAVREK